VWVENDDHFAVKALGEPKSSYLAISKRDSTGLVPRGEMVGGVAINEDNAGIYTQNNEFYKKTNGRVLTGLVADGKGTTTIPIELEVFNNVDGKLVPISKEGNKVVISNRVEIGYGPNPDNILGSSYDKDFPLLTRKVSNRINYNYVEYSEKGFEQYSKMELSMDGFYEGKMTPDRFRMLIDLVDELPDYARKSLNEIQLHRVATMGGSVAAAWGGVGTIEIGGKYFSPDIIKHEATHSATLGNSELINEWVPLFGGTRSRSVVAPVTGYGATNWKEDMAETGAFIYKSPEYTKAYLSSEERGKYRRAKIALLAKHGVISTDLYNKHMANAGYETGPDSYEKYISEVRGK
ncbi:MAG: hypothetical protein WC867_08735, partial [Candidatus Pacearchaeota archaeon]